MISDFRLKNKTKMLNTRCLTRCLTFWSDLQSTNYYLQPKKGVAALLTIVIVSVSALVMAISSSYLSLGELDQGFSEGRGDEALFVATGCMDEALGRLRRNSSYTGGNITQSNGSCIINIATSGSISTTTVTASTTNNYWKKLESVVTVSSGVVTMNSWQEKDN
jgi:uncharacterized membrane protein YwzB